MDEYIRKAIANIRASVNDLEAVLLKNDAPAGIPIHPWSQLDTRWGDDLLGLATDKRYTLAAYGCLLTCFASATEMNPHELNEWLKARKAFADNGEGQFNKVILDSFREFGFYLTVDILCLKNPAPIAEISRLLAGGALVIAGVSHKGAINKVQHYIRVTKLSADGKTVEIIDPLQLPGNEVTQDVSRYANKYGSDPAHVFLRIMLYEAVKCCK